MFFTRCTTCDIGCKDCGTHGAEDPSDGSCVCNKGYGTLRSDKICEGFSRNFFLGEWNAKDTLCTDSSCRENIYTVIFYPHPTDSTLFYAKNLASNACANIDSSIWKVSASDRYIRSFENISNSCIKIIASTDYDHLNRINFAYTINNQTIRWTTILKK